MLYVNDRNLGELSDSPLTVLQLQREREYLESMGLGSFFINSNNITFIKSALELGLEIPDASAQFLAIKTEINKFNTNILYLSEVAEQTNIKAYLEKNIFFIQHERDFTWLYAKK